MAPMKRIDLDDLPPKLAALLTGAEPGEEVLLVQNGAVVGRLTGGAAEPPGTPQVEPERPPEENAKEIFEQFRSMMEDEF
jgi:antitoxin (DNA-binding transcriptional repressor) of toxin-antitoxin stability system